MSEIKYELLESGGVESNTTAQKLFRLRFRVPYSMFRAIVQECIEGNIFGRTIIGVEFKLLGCLRILGRNHVGDDVVEHLKIGGKTVNTMFKTFLNYLLTCTITNTCMFLKERRWMVLWRITPAWDFLGVWDLWT